MVTLFNNSTAILIDTGAKMAHGLELSTVGNLDDPESPEAYTPDGDLPPWVEYPTGAFLEIELERKSLTAEVKGLREALGDLGIAADKVHKELAIIQPFLDVFKKHGKIISDCMAQQALAGEVTT